MSKKKKPTVKGASSDPISRRYKKSASNLLENIAEISYLEHFMVSLTKSFQDDEGNLVETKREALFTKNGSNLVELPGSMAKEAFISHLGNSLRHAGKDGYSHNLLASFFQARKASDGTDVLDHADFVYKWNIENSTISSTISPDDSWNGVPCTAGPEWNGYSFILNDVEDVNPDSFTDDEITEAGVLVHRFFEGVIEKAPCGSHRIESKSSAYPEPAVIVFHKNSEDTVSIEQGIDSKLAQMSAMIIQVGNFSTTLYSFINEDINDSAGLMRDDSIQEVRAWAVERGDIYALNAKQVIDAYCRDFATGKIIETPENINYLPAWKIAL